MSPPNDGAMKRRILYTWMLPLLWCLITLASFFHSGDEHDLFTFGAVAGTWICFLYSFKTLSSALFPVLVIGAGLFCLLGMALDRLRVGKSRFGMLWLVGTILIFALSFGRYDSFARMASKEGSVWAVMIFSGNLGLCGTAIISSLVYLLVRVASGFQKGSDKP